MQIWAISFAAWTIPGILNFAGDYVFLTSAQEPVVFRNLLPEFGTGLVWGIFTPLIYWLSKRYSFGRGTWTKSLAVHLPASLLISALASLLIIKFNAAVGGLTAPTVKFAPRLLFRLLVELPTYYVVLGIAQAVAYYERFREREAQSLQLETKLAQAQLEILKSQLEPHFLFNTLNSIATLTRRDPASAERMIVKLSSLLRVSLDYADFQEVPLQQELQFLKDYVDIQQTRFQDRLTVHWHIDPELRHVAVPSLILQPLVENAIRHGIARSSAPGSITIVASRSGAFVTLEIADNGIGFPGDQESEGLGLRNTRARLQHLYGERHHFSVQAALGQGCRVRLSVPLTQIEPIMVDENADSNLNRR